MSSSIRPDEFSKYAPRWLREGSTKPGDALTLPKAPQLATLHLGAPPWRGRSPFEGEARPSRPEPTADSQTTDSQTTDFQAADPYGADPQTTDTLHAAMSAWLQSGVAERLFRTAAVVSYAVLATGVLGSALFPNVWRSAFQTGTAHATTAASAQTYPKLASTGRLGVSDLWPVDAAFAASEPATKSVDKAPPASASAPQVTNAVYVVASADPRGLHARPQQLDAPARIQEPAAPPVQVQDIPKQAPQKAEAPKQQAEVQKVAAVQPEQSLAPQRVQSQRLMSADEIDRLVKRGEAFLAQGDVATARVFLERAAEAHDARAALALGSTYDPNVLNRTGVFGIQADAAQAHAWYERAAAFGSGEANQRLTALAQLTR